MGLSWTSKPQIWVCIELNVTGFCFIWAAVEMKNEFDKTESGDVNKCVCMHGEWLHYLRLSLCRNDCVLVIVALERTPPEGREAKPIKKCHGVALSPRWRLLPLERTAIKRERGTKWPWVLCLCPLNLIKQHTQPFFHTEEGWKWSAGIPNWLLSCFYNDLVPFLCSGLFMLLEFTELRLQHLMSLRYKRNLTNIFFHRVPTWPKDLIEFRHFV